MNNVGVILRLVVPMKVAATVGVVNYVKKSPGVVKSGSAKDGIVTVAIEFKATVTGANEVVPSVK